MNKPSLPSLVIILGPTGAGKTEISVELAERLGAEIVSADSRTFYRGMDIGTAKPSLADQKRVPHHLIDVTTPDQNWSLAVFQRSAQQTIYEIHARGHLPLLVGGTGQYIRAVIQDWEPPEVEANPELRQVLQKWAYEVGPQAMHARLAILDPESARSIDARNLRRTLRALEVILTTGKRFSEQRKRGQALYRCLQLGITRPRAELYARIDARIQTMLQAGLEIEVQDLLSKGYSADLPAFSAIGYREVIAYLQGKMTLDEAINEMKRATRIYVRRQANWFKASDPDIHWFVPGLHTIDEIEVIIRNWLKTD